MSEETTDLGDPRTFVARFGQAFLDAAGWTVVGGAPDVKKAVIVAAPHTSNWDLAYALSITWRLGLPIRWMGKHTLFRPPFGAIMRKLGGIPVDRRGRNNAVDAAIKLLEDADELMLLIPPEGTRGVAKRWKTGFYHTAVGAKVPIVLGFLDYEGKRGGLGEVFWPTGDIDADMERIRAFYAGMKGKYPHLQGDIKVRE